MTTLQHSRTPTLQRALHSRPAAARAFALFWLATAAYYAYAAIRYHEPTILIFASAAAISTICWLLGETYLRFIASRALLDLSVAFLRSAAQVGNPSPKKRNESRRSHDASAARTEGESTTLRLSEATILGLTSPDDPAEPPVAICELLSILDRSGQRELTLELERYRIQVSTRSPIDRFIELNAGREGATPQLRPWTLNSSEALS